MKLPHYTTPANDNERLLNLQYDYRNGRAEALGEMYALLFTIAYKCINKSKRGQDFCTADREQKAQDAATYVVEQYLTRPSFVIHDSVTGYLHCRINRELNYARECDKMLVFTGKLPERVKQRKSYEYIVTNNATGERTVYHTATEIFLTKTFHGMRKKRLVECINNGTTYKNYRFELLEVNQ
jgi:hypothetical protein